MMHKKDNGLYHNDYSPRYQAAYDIYEKARMHMKKQKRLCKEKEKEEQIDLSESKEP